MVDGTSAISDSYSFNPGFPLAELGEYTTHSIIATLLHNLSLQATKPFFFPLRDFSNYPQQYS